MIFKFFLYGVADQRVRFLVSQLVFMVEFLLCVAFSNFFIVEFLQLVAKYFYNIELRFDLTISHLFDIIKLSDKIIFFNGSLSSILKISTQ